jgi:hypothetical protein
LFILFINLFSYFVWLTFRPFWFLSIVVEEARYVFRPFRFPWLAMSLADEAAWYVTLANAAAWRGGEFGAPKKDARYNSEALSYYTRSLELIGKRLGTAVEKKGIEELIVAVMGCICHDVRFSFSLSRTLIARIWFHDPGGF